MWPDICRTVTIVRATGAGWAPLREGEVCLGRDGQLHNSRRDCRLAAGLSPRRARYSIAGWRTPWP